jgi:hypothetical protein
MKLRTFYRLLVATAMVVETAQLARARWKYSARQIDRIKSKPLLKRPNRPGHFAGNLLRFFYRRTVR